MEKTHGSKGEYLSKVPKTRQKISKELESHLNLLPTSHTTPTDPMRELKYHEKKLLRKVNLYSWKGDENIRVSKILRRYHISDRNDYATYSKLCGHITKLTAKLKTMDGSDPFRIDVTSQMTKKLFDMGVLNNKVGNLKQCEDIGVSSFCRRRLPVVMVRMKMSETLKEAVTFIEQVSERSEASEPG